MHRQRERHHLMASSTLQIVLVSAGAVVAAFLLFQPLLLKIPCYAKQVRKLIASAKLSMTHAFFWKLYWSATLKAQGSSFARRQALLACVHSAFSGTTSFAIKSRDPRLSGNFRCKACAGRVACAPFAPATTHTVSSTNPSSDASPTTKQALAVAQSAAWSMVLERRRQSEQMVPTYIGPSPLLYSPQAIRESLHDSSVGCCTPQVAVSSSHGNHAISCGNCSRVLHAGCMLEYLQRAVSIFRQNSLDHVQKLLLETGTPPCHICCEEIATSASLPGFPAASKPRGAIVKRVSAGAHVALRVENDVLSLDSSTDFVPTPSKANESQRQRRFSKSTAKCSPIGTTHQLQLPCDRGCSATVSDPSASRQITGETA